MPGSSLLDCIYLLLLLYVCVHTGQVLCVEIREQLWGVASLLSPLCGLQGLISASQTCMASAYLLSPLSGLLQLLKLDFKFCYKCMSSVAVRNNRYPAYSLLHFLRWLHHAKLQYTITTRLLPSVDDVGQISPFALCPPFYRTTVQLAHGDVGDLKGLLNFIYNFEESTFSFIVRCFPV